MTGNELFTTRTLGSVFTITLKVNYLLENSGQVIMDKDIETLGSYDSFLTEFYKRQRFALDLNRNERNIRCYD